MTKRQDKPTPLTDGEKAAIESLKALEATWPKSLWLFSASGQLCVMKKNRAGEQATHPGLGAGVDQAFVVDTVQIENDGGDW